MLKRRKESDTYLATDNRHRRSPQIPMKVDKVYSFHSALRPSSAEEEDAICGLRHFQYTSALVGIRCDQKGRTY